MYVDFFKYLNHNETTKNRLQTQFLWDGWVKYYLSA